METQKLTSAFRTETGKGAMRKLRAKGMIPAVLYGSKEETLALALVERDLRRVFRANWETAILELTIEGKEKKECSAIVKDVQQHPATGRVLHLDLQYIHKGEKIRLVIPVHLNGDPRGVKEMGGILEHGPRELHVRCMPRHIPDSIEIDVSELGIQDSIHLRDVIDRFPDVEFLDEHDTTLAIVVPPKVEAEKVEDELEEDADAAEPEVITKGKDEKAEDAGESK